jgi:5'-3' exonuclease
MGIPYYFREIVHQNKQIITHIKKCDRLYLDFNSVIHTASQRVVNAKPWKNYERMEEAIFRSIVDSTYDIVHACPPAQLLYIGIDGIAPLAKMSQQRKRRHLTGLRNKLVMDFKKHNNIPFSVWDSNCITPGTDFMKRLQHFLESQFKDLPCEVIISGPNEHGEGEHKIINYIKSLGDDKCIDIIYGLDADLIMLSLTCSKSKIYLLRESSQIFTPKRGSYQNHQTFMSYKTVDIDTLKRCVGDFMMATSSSQHTPEMHRNFINDYVFICFVLGNDFLPHFPSIDIKYNGIEILCNTYKETYNELNTFAITDGHINPQFIMTFLEKLVQNEDARFKNNLKEYYEMTHIPRHFKTPLEQYTHDLDYFPIINRTAHKIVDPDSDPFWKTTYYSRFFGINNPTTNYDDICEEFVKGLVWNARYYFQGISDHSWYYKYNAAPFMVDVLNYLRKQSDLKSLFHPQNLQETQLEVSALEQLLIVLPYTSHNLIPNKHLISKIQEVENGLVHLYPVAFDIISFMKTQMWECTPLLPPIDIKKIKTLLQNTDQ